MIHYFIQRDIVMMKINIVRKIFCRLNITPTICWNKNINEVQKSPCVMTRIKWTDILGVMKYSQLYSSKPWN